MIGKFRDGFSKPQFSNLKNFINGIIKTEHRRTVVHINEGSDTQKDQSQLNRFLTAPKWDKPRIEKSYIDNIVSRTIDQSGRYAYCIIDETIKEVSTPKNKTDGVAKYYDNSQHRFVYGHKFSTSCITNGEGFTTPYRLELFLKKGDARKCGIKYKKITKMAEETIDQFALLDVKDREKVALFDSYYAVKKVLKRAQKQDIRFVSRVKSNRKFILNEKTMHAKDSKKKLKVAGNVTIKGVVYQYSEVKKAELCNFGEVYVVWSKPVDPKQGKKVQVFITDMEMEGKDILEMYSIRWEIEVMHKDLKQNFGLEDYRLRRLESVKTFALLCKLLYGIIAVIKADILSKYAAKTTEKLYAEIREFFTAGKICSILRRDKSVFVELLDYAVKFRLKNAKL
jgi:hypothetical protein